MRRGSFDELIEMNVNADRVTYEDLSINDRAELVARYFQENGEWGEAFFDGMENALEAFKAHDDACLGFWIARKMQGYVRPYIDRQLSYMAMCKREQQEMRDERRA